jgi:uncharacterized SAM-binding protein YcdF (DUF218 family)
MLLIKSRNSFNKMNSRKEHQKVPFFRGCFRWFGGAVGCITAVISLSLLGYLFLRGAGAFLIIADELTPVDAIIIMGGGDEGRMDEALELYRQKYARLIILTETGEREGEFDYLQSFDLRIQLLNNGIPSGNILITDSEVSSTLEEGEAVKQLLERRQIASAIIVTDPFHTKRTSIIFNDVFFGQDKRIYYRPVTPSWYNSRTWFLSADGWKFTILEYLKLAAYKLGIQI